MSKKAPKNELELLNKNAAGLDIGAAEIYAHVPRDRDEESVRMFKTFTSDLHGLAEWLKVCRIETVAMESTGVYWIPVYELLESQGFEVLLVNARHVKNVPGRKSDVADCEWIQRLHTYGLLRGSFRPKDEMVALRSLVRNRRNLTESRSKQIHLMQKALEQMNVKLTQVVSDITGVTGISIIREIIEGEREPKELAKLRNAKCQKSEDEIAKALEGNYRNEHLFALKQAVEAYDFYERQLQDCDSEIEKHIANLPTMAPGEDTLPPKPRTTKRRKNQPHFDLTTSLYDVAGVDLTEIDGIDSLTAQTVISEIGLDMTCWPTVKHFCSWLGLAPQHEISGGKILRTRTKKTNNRANTALRVAAQSLSRSDSALGAFYRRMRAKNGPQKAITATAHKLARIIYFMLRDKTPYHDPGADYFDQQHRQRSIRNLQRQAARLGFNVVPTDYSDDSHTPALSPVS